jgi:hypothetical protein
MPTNRFGEVNSTPLYNATGRINRGEAPQVAPFSPANAGTQRDWSAMKRPEKSPNPFADAFDNISQMNRWYGNSPRSGGGGGGGGGGFSADDITKIVGALPPVTATFAPQDTGKYYGDSAVSRPRVTDNWQPPQNAQGTVFAPQTTAKNYGDSVMGGSAEPAQPSRAPRAPRTDEQKKATAEKRAQKKAENPAYGTRNPSRTPKPVKPKTAAKPAKPSKTGAVINDASSNNAFQGNDNTFGGGGDGSPAPGFMNAGKIEGMAISTAGNATQRK